MRGGKDRALLFLKGMAMGAADVVPGVSGGTIAFITNIYDTLIESIHNIGPKTLLTLRREGLISAWNSFNGNFLLVLFLGVATSIFTLAKFITHLLQSYPILVWSFFFGLIVVSAIYVIRQIKNWNISVGILLVIGALSAWMISGMTPSEIEPTYMVIFFSGALAICAMILPGISGSFILLMLGMYSHVLIAIKGLDLVTLGIFGAGCILGLLSFSRILNWLLKHYHEMTMGLLAGFMIGSLNKVWPWKETLSFRTNSHGD
ncbi:MAG: DUF368 domain-containing protein, partial [Pseudomonadales bacterium]|nr:DUF368 domain-containing protein [Pseudomonadales bacterium]